MKIQKNKIAMSVFLFLQAARVYDLLANDYNAQKWMLVDMAFLLLLAQTLPTAAITAVFSLWNGYLLVWPKTAIRRAGIAGSTTVRIQPWSSARLARAKCIDRTQFGRKGALDIHTQGTAPWTVEISQDSKKTKTVRTRTEKSTVEIHEPGTYKIVSVLDGNGLPGKIVDSDCVVDYCPYCAFVEQKEAFCGNTQAKVAAEFRGQGPFEVILSVGERFLYLKDQTDSLAIDGKISGVYRLESVTDRTGGEYKYHKDEQTVSVLFYTPPSAAWTKKTATLLEGVGSMEAQVQFAGTPPFTADIVNVQTKKRVALVSRKTLQGVKIREKGVYRITRVKDAHCSRDTSDEMEIRTPPKPTLQLHLAEDSRVIDMTLTGEGPWTVLAIEKTEKGVREHTHETDSAKYRIEWTPSHAGRNTMQFVLSDTNYRNIECGRTLSHTVAAKESVRFAGKKENVLCCVGRSLGLQLATDGVFPAMVEYEVTQPGGEKTTHKTKKREVRIEQMQSGVYTVKLLGGTQAQRTVSAVQPPTLRLKERVVLWKKENEQYTVEVEATGTAPLSAAIKTEKGVVERKIVGGKISLDIDGECEIVAVQNHICKTEIHTENRFVARTHPKPKVSFKGERETVCYAQRKNFCFRVETQGALPIDIVYEEELHGVKRKVAATVKENRLLCLKHEREPGTYRYTVLTCTDRNYRNVQTHSTLTQTVAKKRKVALKSNEVSSATELAVVVDGALPAVLFYRIDGEKEVSAVLGKKETKISIDLQPGEHVLTALHTVDTDGCVEPCEEKLFFSVLQEAALTFSRETLCPDTTLTATLTGKGPWNIQTEIKNTENKTEKKKNTTVFAPSFDIFLSRPGMLNITVSSKTSLPKTYSLPIRESPRAILNGGRDTVHQIREGETVSIPLELSGTPPFTVTYRRTSGDTVEIVSEDKIETHHTEIVVKQNGKFEIIAVQDRHCLYRPNVTQSSP
ncbi:MAG: nucleoporin Pom152 [Amphiamblys sp. WSBS2006]|nr:MAG: nucleoporin Pom152 [Amphiamblys sp. WSBS2006]